MPQRIQRKRTKGWTTPPKTRYCGRPSVYGNPYIVTAERSAETCVRMFRNLMRIRLRGVVGSVWRNRLEALRNYDYLSCWCAADKPCHVDVWIELLNEPPENTTMHKYSFEGR